MNKMIKFPSIEQFRNVVRHVKTHARYVGKDQSGEPIFDASIPIPTLKFKGTTKLHGTNAGVVYNYATDSFHYQSRERVLTLDQDNAGFMLYMKQYNCDLILRDIANQAIFEVYHGNKYISHVAIFGEWCGGNIQKGVAISGLPKMFVIFAVKIIFDGEDESMYLPIDEFDIHHSDDKIFNIDTFGSHFIDIDFNHPELAQNKMIELTIAVEDECPVGKYFGQEGVGEGIVWTCITPNWNDSGTWFKVKGEKHSVSKVRTLAAVDVEAVQAVADFVAATVTENRLEQALRNLVDEQLKPFEMKSMGDFIRWVFNDIMKEEMDTMIASQIDPKKLGGPIANIARPWFINKLNSETDV